MSKLILGADRTRKQPIVWRCSNIACRESNLDRFFEFESDQPECPKCKAKPPVVQVRSLVHMLVQKHGGPIAGMHGKRYAIACDEKRSHLATPTNMEAASGDIAAVNCPGCLKEIGNSLSVSGKDITTDLFK